MYGFLHLMSVVVGKITLSKCDIIDILQHTFSFLQIYTTQHRGVYIKKLFVRVCVCASGGKYK
jgi:hypothetical protein